MDFDIVIATRNRTASLRLSLPLMLSQRRLPRALIVVDASDDASSPGGGLPRRVGETERVVRDSVAASGASLRFRVVPSEAGTSLQRNIGLTLVESPVVLFPDDDALWFPGFAESVMRIYERDAEGLIGAVAGTESPEPPPGVLPGARAASDGLSVRIPGVVEKALDLFERTFFPDPFFAQARLLCRAGPGPGWLAGERAHVAPTMTGFRMSFRTDLIRRTGFDEALGRYSLFEDHDACMSVLRSHLIVVAESARVFHHRVPEQRADPFELGVMHILNRAYILSKHAPAGSPSTRPALMRYACYKLVRYLLRSHSPAMRRRLAGAWRATRRASLLCRTGPSGDLPERYLRLREECLGRGAARSSTGRAEPAVP